MLSNLQYLRRNLVNPYLDDENKLRFEGVRIKEELEFIKEHHVLIVDELNREDEELTLYYLQHPTASYVYDVEVYPNYFSICFINVADPNDVHFFSECYFPTLLLDTGKKVWIQRDRLLRFLNRPITLIGYNNYRYDDLILKHYLRLGDPYQLSVHIIEGDGIVAPEIRLFPVQWKTIDLMKIGHLFISLKSIAIKLDFENVSDLPLPPHKHIDVDQVPMMVEYNINDVRVTLALYERYSDSIQMRYDLEDLYMTPLMVSDSNLGERILRRYYQDVTNTSYHDLADSKTVRQIYEAKEFITDDIPFQTDFMKEVYLQYLELVLIPENRFRVPHQFTCEFDGLTYKLGVGGLHSVDTGGSFLAEGDTSIIDLDVSSYYPSIIYECGLVPAHLDEDVFRELYKRLLDLRLQRKAEGNHLESGVLKLALNAVFGQSKSPYSWLFDAAVNVSTCLYGQLYLLLLIEDLVVHGIRVISANTDGVFVLGNKDNPDLDAVINRWMLTTGFNLESSSYDAYFRKDVNNYMMLKSGSIAKSKGIFSLDDNLMKDQSGKVIKRAIIAYFRDGEPIECSVKSNLEFYDFIMSKNIGAKFRLQLGDQVLQRHSRFIMVKDGYGDYLKKVEVTNLDRSISVWKDQLVMEVNDLRDRGELIEGGFRDIIDYDFYVREAQKVIDKIATSG